MGFQLRCASATIMNSSVSGGLNGIRVAAVAHAQTPRYQIVDFNCRDLAQLLTSSLNSDAAIRTEDQSALTFPAMLNVVDPVAVNCGRGLSIGAKTLVNVVNGTYHNVDGAIDIYPGAMLRHHGTLVSDCSAQTRTNSNAKVAYMRSDAPSGGSSLFLDRLRVVMNSDLAVPNALIQEQDTTATKYFHVNEAIIENPAGLTQPPLINASATTIVQPTTMARTAYNTLKSVTNATYTVLPADSGQIIYLNRATAQTITVGKNLPAGFRCHFVQIGAGQATFAAESGATQRVVSASPTTDRQFAVVELQVHANSTGAAADYTLRGGLIALSPSRVVTAAGAITATKADYYIGVNKTTGAATVVNLPAMVAADAGFEMIIKDEKLDALTNPITITPAAGNIVGTARATTYVVATNGASTKIIYNGTEWVVV
jgi:hypothetical protein